jgi:hypothetical protein
MPKIIEAKPAGRELADQVDGLPLGGEFTRRLNAPRVGPSGTPLSLAQLLNAAQHTSPDQGWPAHLTPEVGPPKGGARVPSESRRRARALGPDVGAAPPETR